VARSMWPLPRENRAKPKRPGSDNIQTMAGPPPRTPRPPPARAIAAAPAPTTFYIINSSDDDYENHSHSHMIRSSLAPHGCVATGEKQRLRHRALPQRRGHQQCVVATLLLGILHAPATPPVTRGPG
jgi:hypothetical protein